VRGLPVRAIVSSHQSSSRSASAGASPATSRWCLNDRTSRRREVSNAPQSLGAKLRKFLGLFNCSDLTPPALLWFRVDQCAGVRFCPSIFASRSSCHLRVAELMRGAPKNDRRRWPPVRAFEVLDYLSMVESFRACTGLARA
jgi:hypothetical protein